MDEQAVRNLCEAADLELGEERLALIAPQLTAWLDAANELNRKLASAEHRVVQPIAVFRHPSTEGSDE